MKWKKNEFLFRMVVSDTCCVFLNVRFVLFYFFCVCIWLQIQHKDPLQECHSIRLGSCGMIYYCAPLVRMPDVIGVLAVWRHNKPKKKNRRGQGRISHCTAHWRDLTEAIFWETLRVPVWSPKWSQKSIRVRRVKEWGVTCCPANVTLRPIVGRKSCTRA